MAEVCPCCDGRGVNPDEDSLWGESPCMTCVGGRL